MMDVLRREREVLPNTMKESLWERLSMEEAEQTCWARRIRIAFFELTILWKFQLSAEPLSWSRLAQKIVYQKN